MNCKDPSSRLVRWRLKLEECQYEIAYKPGKINSNADGLSRNPVLFTGSLNYDAFIKYHYENQELIEYPIEKSNIFDKNPNTLLFSNDFDPENKYFNWVNETYNLEKYDLGSVNLYDVGTLTNDNNRCTYLLITHLNYFDTPSSKAIFYCLQNLNHILTGTNKIYVKNPKSYNNRLDLPIIFEMLQYTLGKNRDITLIAKQALTPGDKNEVNRIITEHHSTSLNGHSGIKATYRKIKENYFWQGMKSDIRKFIQKCKSCNENKTNSHPIRAPMQITSTASKPFEKIFMDIVDPLPLTESGDKNILTI